MLLTLKRFKYPFGERAIFFTGALEPLQERGNRGVDIEVVARVMEGDYCGSKRRGACFGDRGCCPDAGGFRQTDTRGQDARLLDKGSSGQSCSLR